MALLSIICHWTWRPDLREFWIVVDLIFLKQYFLTSNFWQVCHYSSHLWPTRVSDIYGWSRKNVGENAKVWLRQISAYLSWFFTKVSNTFWDCFSTLSGLGTQTLGAVGIFGSISALLIGDFLVYQRMIGGFVSRNCFYSGNGSAFIHFSYAWTASMLLLAIWVLST